MEEFEMIDVNQELPRETHRGIHDAFPVLVLLNEPYGHVSQFNYKIVTWCNNSFLGFPSGARKVTHWQYLPEIPEEL